MITAFWFGLGITLVNKSEMRVKSRSRVSFPSLRSKIRFSICIYRVPPLRDSLCHPIALGASVFAARGSSIKVEDSRRLFFEH